MIYYSVEIRYDDDGTPTYGVYQGANFIMPCPTMQAAGVVAEALSTEYKRGLDYGEGVGYNDARRDIINGRNDAVDLGEPPELSLADRIRARSEEKQREAPIMPEFTSGEGEKVMPGYISAPMGMDTPQPENYQDTEEPFHMLVPKAPPPPGTPPNEQESMLTRLRKETDPEGELWDDFDGPGDDITRIHKGSAIMMRPNRKQREAMGWDICDEDVGRLWQDQYRAIPMGGAPLTEGSTRGGTGAIKEQYTSRDEYEKKLSWKHRMRMVLKVLGWVGAVVLMIYLASKGHDWKNG